MVDFNSETGKLRADQFDGIGTLDLNLSRLQQTTFLLLDRHLVSLVSRKLTFCQALWLQFESASAHLAQSSEQEWAG